MIRFYGKSPCRVAVVHGGPGGIGSARGLAEGILQTCGESVAEPLQSKYSVAELVEELREQLLAPELACPVVLIGHSWGAWLAAFAAERYPALVRRLILVGSAPLRADGGIDAVRLSRFSEAGLNEYHSLLKKLEDTPEAERNSLLSRLGALCEEADTYSRLDSLPVQPCECDGEMYRRVWSEAAAMRSSGELAGIFCRLRVPVTIIHGDYDPHPPEGVRAFLEERGVPHEFRLLSRCGHTPWIERFAREEFFRLLTEDIRK